MDLKAALPHCIGQGYLHGSKINQGLISYDLWRISIMWYGLVGHPIKIWKSNFDQIDILARATDSFCKLTWVYNKNKTLTHFKTHLMNLVTFNLRMSFQPWGVVEQKKTPKSFPGDEHYINGNQHTRTITTWLRIKQCTYTTARNKKRLPRNKIMWFGSLSLGLLSAWLLYSTQQIWHARSGSAFSFELPYREPPKKPYIPWAANEVSTKKGDKTPITRHWWRNKKKDIFARQLTR